MSFSLGPFITCCVGIIFLTVYLYIILYCLNNHLLYGSKIIFIGITIIFLRMCIPVNFPFTYTIYSTKLLPKFTNLVFSNIGQSDYMISDIFFIIWLIIAVVKLFGLLIKKLRLHYYLKAYTISAEQYPRLSSAIKKCCSKSVNLAVIPYNISPSISGILHPTVIFPDSYEFLSDEKLCYLCMHEINHYRNHDLWIKLLTEIVCCVQWWNPLVYLMKREYSLALELANDYQLMRTYPGFNKEDYAELILEIAKRTSDIPFKYTGGTIPFLRTSNSVLKTRINFVINTSPEQNRKKGQIMPHIIIVCIAMFFSLILVVDPSSRNPSSPISEDGSFEPNASNTYLIHTPEGYEIYVEDNYMGTNPELPEDFKDYRIYEQGEEINEE